MTNDLIQADETRNLLRQARETLASGRAKVDAGSDFSGLLQDSLLAARAALRAFLTWHQVPWSEDDRLLLLVESASNLARGIETPAQSVLPLETLSRAIRGRDRLSAEERDTIRNGYYAARNTYSAVAAELPETVLPAPQNSIL